ncbi:MAG: FlgO family outer membrane protein [Pseudomonadota bacterium]
MKALQHIIISGLAIVCVACAPGPFRDRGGHEPSVLKPSKAEIDDSHLIRASYEAVDRVLYAIETSRLSYKLDKNRPLLVSSFVDVDDVRFSSTFGRMLGEQVGSRFSQSGYRVVEVKMREGSIFVPNPDRGLSQGELTLSREVKNLSMEQDSQAVVAGTYAEARDIVYVTVKVINTQDGVIIYSTDFSMPIDPDTRRLLRDNKRNRRVRL